MSTAPVTRHPCPPGRQPRCLVWLIALWAAAAVVLAEAAPLTTREAWRAQVNQARQLAENDTVQAYTLAQRLQSELPGDAQPADRARLLNLLSRIEIYRASTQLAGRHADAALAIAREHGDRVGQAEAHLNIALNSVNEGRIDALITATTASVAVLDGVDRPDLLGEALLRTAMMYRRMGQLDDSVTLAMQAMEIARGSKNPLVLTYAHQGLGISFDQSHQRPQAREHFTQMREQARRAHSKLLEAYALSGLGGVVGAMGDLGGAEKTLREAVALYREVDAPFAVAFGQFAVAENLRRQGRMDAALALLDEVRGRYEQHPNRIGLWYVLNLRSELLQSLGQRAAARADAERALSLAREVAFPLYLSGSARRMAALSADEGDHRRAYALSVEATEMTTRAAQERAGQRMLELAQRYEVESRQRGIAELQRRNEQQQVALQQHALQERWSWTVAVASLLLLAVTAAFLHRLRGSHRQVEAANARLVASEQQVRSLNVGLEQRVQARTAELRQQARYLRTLIDLLPMWAWLKDTGGRYLVTNQAHAAARGCDAAAMEGRTDQELLPPELARAQQADDAEVIRRGERRTVEAPLPGAAATTWMETYKAPVLDDDGTVLGTVGAARDISERKAAEAAKEHALAEARRLAQNRSEFMTQMNHELRTPLNGILGFAQVLLQDRSLTDAQLRGLRVIQHSGQHVLSLINDLLDLARIDAGKLELAVGPVDLERLLSTVTDLVHAQAGDKGLALHCRPGPGLPAVVMADEQRLRQVLLNLLSNAVKFTDEGSVTLTVQALPLPGRPGTATARLRFEVNDTGIGLSDAQQARLFQVFEQLGDARRREGGSGLGLAICRQLVGLMGGVIEVRSEPGRGSSFSFELELPVIDTSPGPGRARSGPGRARPGPEKVEAT